MPTFETCPRFTTDLQHLTPAQRGRFRRVVLDAFVPDLRTGRLRALRSPDGRATWSYGRVVVAGLPHVVWHRIPFRELGHRRPALEPAAGYRTGSIRSARRFSPSCRSRSENVVP